MAALAIFTEIKSSGYPYPSTKRQTAASYHSSSFRCHEQRSGRSGHTFHSCEGKKGAVWFMTVVYFEFMLGCKFCVYGKVETKKQVKCSKNRKQAETTICYYCGKQAWFHVANSCHLLQASQQGEEEIRIPKNRIARAQRNF